MVILIGAGSLSTSVLAACAVPGIMRALAGTQARTIYVANLHEQVPETSGYSLPDHVDALHYHGVNPHVVLVDNHSAFATQACSPPKVVADIAREDGLVHDVQKLAKAVLAQVR